MTKLRIVASVACSSLALLLLALGFLLLFGPIIGGYYEGGEQVLGMMLGYGLLGVFIIAFSLGAIMLKSGSKVVVPYIAIGSFFIVPLVVFVVALIWAKYTA